jgi:hypothetical protein
MNFLYKKLFTKEDSTNIHKILGIGSLINYVYRYGLLFTYGTMMFNNNSSIFTLLLHGLLSTSSLIFHIPNIRNSKAPMIYPEYRMHSIIFAYRSIVCCFIHYYNLNYLYIILTCYITMICADFTTYLYNINKKNGTTMKNMPFNDNISIKDQNKITLMHSSSQIAATLFMFGNIDTAFSPMFAIQMAALLMTLVRKNIISTNMWHILYSLTLWINIYFYNILCIDFIITHYILYTIYTNIFFYKKMNKYINWTIIFILYYIKYTFYPYIFYNYLYNIEHIFRIITLIVFAISNYSNIKILL